MDEGKHLNGGVMIAAYTHTNPFVIKTIEPLFQNFVKRKAFLETEFERLNLEVKSKTNNEEDLRKTIQDVWVKLTSTIKNQPRTDDKIEVERYFKQVKIELSNLRDDINRAYGCRLLK